MAKKVILNFTQHKATAEQLKAGVVEPSEEEKQDIQLLLTFEEMPTLESVRVRSFGLATIAWHISQGRSLNPSLKKGLTYSAMIGGGPIENSPFLMPSLDSALRSVGITPVYAFSKRESTEVDDGEGGIQKTATFRHLGFV